MCLVIDWSPELIEWSATEYVCRLVELNRRRTERCQSSMDDIGLSTQFYFKILKDMWFHICIPQIYKTEFSNNRCMLFTYTMYLQHSLIIHPIFIYSDSNPY